MLSTLSSCLLTLDPLNGDGWDVKAFVKRVFEVALFSQTKIISVPIIFLAIYNLGTK